MTLKLLFSLFIPFLLITAVKAQKYTLTPKIGYANYSTVDLTAFQDYLILSNSISFDKTDTFPARPYLQLILTKNLKDGNQAGVFMGYLSTGGRVAASDYSGKVTSDQILTNFELGFNLDIYLEKEKYFTPFIQAQLTALLSELELIDHVEITDGEKFNEEISMVSENIAFSPSFGLQFHKLAIPLKLTVGYLIQVTDFPFHLRENRNATLRVEGNHINPGLSGIRIGISSDVTF